MEITKDCFGPLWKYVSCPSITDIDYNGREIWITDLEEGHYPLEDSTFTESILKTGFLEQFTQRIANLVSRQFNRRNPRLEAETSDLRVTILHESVARTGRCFSIRKTPPVLRMDVEDSIESGYCSKEIMSLLVNCVQSNMNLVFCGLPGAGKTESLKFFSRFIEPEDRVITIEDTLEIHYSQTCPEMDCVELKVDEEVFPYTDAIKAGLRLNPKWLILSEARSVEVKYLLECWSTGVNGMTTLHASDVRNVPDRILNMLASRTDADRLENDIYQSVDVAILVKRVVNENGKIMRRIDQLGFFTRENGCNQSFLLLSDRKLEGEIPASIRLRLKMAGFPDPFYNPQIEEELEWAKIARA